MSLVQHERAADVVAFERVAAQLGRTLRPGDAVAVSGELGAGKTTFIRAVVRTLHGADQATSPTFTLRHRYDGEPPIEHVDLYRIEDPRETAELGLEDAFAPDTVTLVEWPERLPELLPAGALRVRIAGVGDGPRTIAIER